MEAILNVPGRRSLHRAYLMLLVARMMKMMR